MSLIKRLCKAFKPAPTVYVEIKIGRRGKYRWYIYDKNDKLIAQAPIGGEHTYKQAMDLATSVIGESYAIRIKQSKVKKAS